MILSFLYALGPVGFLLIAVMAVLWGCFLKRFVLVVLSVLIGLDTIPDMLDAFRTGEIGMLIGLLLALVLVAALLPMWIAHFVKRAGGIAASLRRVKDCIIDTEKN